MAKQTIFERAAKVAESGSSSECAKMISELEAAARKDAADLDAVRPPGQQVHAGGGRLVGILPTGSKCQAAAEAGDRQAFEQCVAEFQMLTARVERSNALIAALKKRKAQAETDERIAAAPAQAKAAIKALDDLLDRHQAVIAEFNAVHSDVAAAVRSLIEAREADRSVPGPSVELFYRAGVALAYMPPTRRQAVEGGISSPQRTTEPLFGSAELARNYAKVLIDVPRSVWERTREILGMRDAAGQGLDAHWRPDTSDTAVRQRLNYWYSEFVRLLGEGKPEAATKLPAPTMKHGNARFTDAA